MCNENTIEKLKSVIDAYVAECPVNPEAAELKLRIALLREAGSNPLEAVALRSAVTRLAMSYPAPLHVAVFEIAKRAYDQIPKDLNRETLMGMFSDYVGDRQTDRLLAAERLQIVLFMLRQLKVAIATIMQRAAVAAQQIDPGYRAELMESVETSLAEIRSYRRQRHINNNAVYGATYSPELLLYGIKESGIRRGELATLGGTLPWTAVPEKEAKPVRDFHDQWLGQFSPERFPTLNPCGEVPIPVTGRGFTESAVTFDELSTGPDVSSPLHGEGKKPRLGIGIQGLSKCLKTATGSNNFEAIWEAAQRRHPLKYLHLQADMANNEKDSTAMTQHGKTVWDLCSDASLNQLFNNINRPKEDTMQTSTRNQIALELGPKIRQHHLRNSSEVVVNGTFHSMADFTGNEVSVIDTTENELIECGLKDTFLEIQAPNIELGKPYMFRLVQLGEKISVQCNDLSNALIKFCQLPDIGRLIAVAKQQPPLLPLGSKDKVQKHYGTILKMKDHSFIKGAYLGLTALGKLVWVDEGSLTDPKECLTADEITKLNAHVPESAPEHYDAEFIRRVKRGYDWSALSYGNSFEGELLVVLDDELFALNKETGVIEHWLEDATTELKAAVSAQHGWTEASVPEDVLLDHLATLDDNDKVAKFHYSHVTKDSDGDRTCDHGVIFTMLPAHPMYNYYRKLAEELEGDE